LELEKGSERIMFFGELPFYSSDFDSAVHTETKMKETWRRFLFIPEP
jgi:hypothetical protein